MTDVTFFHHERFDGGLRTGLAVDGQREMEVFIPGDEETTPALRWYLDVSRPTARPPLGEAQTLAWWRIHGGEFLTVIGQVAEELQFGCDPGYNPYSREFPGPEGAFRVSLRASFAVSHDVGDRIRRQLLDRWAELFRTAELAPA